jgi:hypothetical protein
MGHGQNVGGECEMKVSNRSLIVSLSRQATLKWPGLKIKYAWEPPDEAVGVAKPNQVEIAFTAHAKAAFETRQRASQIDISPGTAFIVGADTITWSKLEEQNESLGMYPDMELLQRLAQTTNTRSIELETMVNCQDPILLGIAHVFKRNERGSHSHGLRFHRSESLQADNPRRSGRARSPQPLSFCALFQSHHGPCAASIRHCPPHRAGEAAVADDNTQRCRDRLVYWL